jgi:hypothetical protein
VLMRLRFCETTTRHGITPLVMGIINFDVLPSVMQLSTSFMVGPREMVPDIIKLAKEEGLEPIHDPKRDNVSTTCSPATLARWIEQVGPLSWHQADVEALVLRTYRSLPQVAMMARGCGLHDPKEVSCPMRDRWVTHTMASYLVDGGPSLSTLPKVNLDKMLEDLLDGGMVIRAWER